MPEALLMPIALMSGTLAEILLIGAGLERFEGVR